MSFSLNFSHESAKKPLSPEERAHLILRSTRLNSKVRLGRGIAVSYPELVGVVIDESDLIQPEQNNPKVEDQERGAAPVQAVVDALPTTPIDAMPLQPPQTQAQEAQPSQVDYELIG